MSTVVATPETKSAAKKPALTDYAIVGALLTAYGALLQLATAAPSPAAPERLIGPMVALVALTALVWLLMVLARNLAVVFGRASVQYYVDYASAVPDERIERPARTFNNLMQVPTLFYAVCLLMMVTKQLDGGQLAVAWLFVAARAVHALVYIAVNKVTYRFAAWIAGCLALGVLWTRFAMQTSALW